MAEELVAAVLLGEAVLPYLPSNVEVAVITLREEAMEVCMEEVQAMTLLQTSEAQAGEEQSVLSGLAQHVASPQHVQGIYNDSFYRNRKRNNKKSSCPRG